MSALGDAGPSPAQRRGNLYVLAIVALLFLHEKLRFSSLLACDGLSRAPALSCEWIGDGITTQRPPSSASPSLPPELLREVLPRCDHETLTRCAAGSRLLCRCLMDDPVFLRRATTRGFASSLLLVGTVLARRPGAPRRRRALGADQGPDEELVISVLVLSEERDGWERRARFAREGALAPPRWIRLDGFGERSGTVVIATDDVQGRLLLNLETKEVVALVSPPPAELSRAFYLYEMNLPSLAAALLNPPSSSWSISQPPGCSRRRGGREADGAHCRRRQHLRLGAVVVGTAHSGEVEGAAVGGDRNDALMRFPEWETTRCMVEEEAAGKGPARVVRREERHRAHSHGPSRSSSRRMVRVTSIMNYPYEMDSSSWFLTLCKTFERKSD